jgi:hypothetical protein
MALFKDGLGRSTEYVAGLVARYLLSNDFADQMNPSVRNRYPEVRLKTIQDSPTGLDEP